MMRIAIVGASSQIAKDLIRSFVKNKNTELMLYVRNVAETDVWMKKNALGETNCNVYNYSQYGKEPHEVVINFVGIGDPKKALDLGAKIFDITHQFDTMVLDQMKLNPDRRYVFLSSGAAYGDAFDKPVDDKTLARVDINNVKPQDFYAIAKLYAEARHRSFSGMAITDIRVFNYFSRTQDLSARFLIADILRSIKENSILRTTQDYIVRDYIHPIDFAQLVDCVIKHPPINIGVDCYSREPVDKPTLLNAMKSRFGLKYESVANEPAIIANATGLKPYYYSTNMKASQLGYKPTYSSIETIISECDAVLKSI